MMFLKKIALSLYLFGLSATCLHANIHDTKSVALSGNITQKGTISLSTTYLNFGEIEPPEGQNLNVTVNVTSSSVKLYGQSNRGGMTLIGGNGTYTVSYSLFNLATNTTIVTSPNLMTKTLLATTSSTTTYNYQIKVSSIPQAVFGTFSDTLTFTLEDT